MSGAGKAVGAGDMRTVVCAIAGLACMFAGIWLADGQLLGANVSEAGTLSMRVCTCIVYLVFYLAARRFLRKGKSDVRWFFGISTVAGFALFIGGACLSLFVMPALERESLAWSAAGICALAMIKTIGAPLSMGFVCLFARLESGMVMRACTLGMLGAFALYSLASQNHAVVLLGPLGSVALAGAALAVALLSAMVGFGGVPTFGAAGGLSLAPGAPGALSVPGVVKRPHNKVVTPGFVIMLVFSAMMLGFLRNGFTGGDYHNDPVSFVALIVLLAVAFAWRGLRIEHVFYGALLCTAVGILLARPLAWALPGLEEMMCGLGTALFEVVSWALVVWAARNSVETLRAAAGMRLAATVGHLLGTIVVAVGMILAASTADALFASEQLMVFIYMVLLVVLLKFPGLQAPFASASDASEYSMGSVRAGVRGVQDEGDSLGAPAEVGGLGASAVGSLSASRSDGRHASSAAGETFAGAVSAEAGEVADESAVGAVAAGVAGAAGAGVDAEVAAAGAACAGAVDAPDAAGRIAGASKGDRDVRASAGAGFSSPAEAAVISAGVPVPFVPAPLQAPLDPVAMPCDTIARTYRLTAREREVLELIAHGRNMPFMEQELVISRNTLKMHIRHIYTKLDVHSKQEIIDMVEALIRR